MGLYIPSYSLEIVARMTLGQACLCFSSIHISRIPST
jgi:hypothetical protein